ncbi:MAG: tetratricopeptide repeat protein, partial [Planctomycetota bacterium]
GEVFRIQPKFSLEYFAKTLPFKNQADKERYVGALRKAGLPDKPPLPLPDKPSIGVLPFTNMSEDPKQEYFSDGMTEEIITALSKVPQLFVIARHSTFTYKGKPVKVQQVGRELGVKYVLEGSVRKAGNKVRITAQLVDAQSGHHLWAERYDRDLDDIFAVQDEITQKIITAMQVKLTKGEQIRAAAKGTNMQAVEYALQFNKESVAMAQRLSEEAIDLDPAYATAYTHLGLTHLHDVFLGRSKSPKESMANAIKYVKKAIELDDSDAVSHSVLGMLFIYTKQYDKSVSKGELAVNLNPNAADTHALLGMIYRYVGRWEDAIEEYKKAVRLNPIPPTWYLWGIGLSYAMTGQYEEGIRECKKAIQQAPNSPHPHMHMTMIYGLAGLEEEARAQAEELLRINPKFSVEHWKKRLTYKNQSDKEQIINALLMAGLK